MNPYYNIPKKRTNIMSGQSRNRNINFNFFSSSLKDTLPSKFSAMEEKGTGQWYCKHCGMRDCQLGYTMWPLYHFSSFSNREHIEIDMDNGKLLIYEDNILKREWTAKTNKLISFFDETVTEQIDSDVVSRIEKLVLQISAAYDCKPNTWGRKQLIQHNLDIINLSVETARYLPFAKFERYQKNKLKYNEY